MIVLYSGRRVDAADAKPARFPLSNVPRVRQAAEALLTDTGARVVVGSAACGADLLVLEAAGRLGLRRRVVLPFDRERFKQTSVIDRPGDWAATYDAVIAAAAAAGDLVELALDPDEPGTYAAANLEIFRQAESLAAGGGQRSCAAVIWDGHSRGSGDVTQAFLLEAGRRGIPAKAILTV